MSVVIVTVVYCSVLHTGNNLLVLVLNILGKPFALGVDIFAGYAGVV